MITSASWVRDFALRLGVDVPSDEELAMILALAGEAAHASERTAAPVACWLAARMGLTPDAALEVARGVVVEEA